MQIIDDKIFFEFKKRNDKYFNLILDLDQTLIHTEISPVDNHLHNLFDNTSFYSSLSSNFNLSKYMRPLRRRGRNNILRNCHPTILFEYTQDFCHYKVHGRKDLFLFLMELCKYFNIYIYTNGTHDYAKNICDFIVSKIGDHVITGIISRKNSFSSERKYISILPYFNKNNSIIVDDRKDVWDGELHENLILIKEYVYNSIEHMRDNDLEIIKGLLMFYKDYINNQNLPSVIKHIENKYIERSGYDIIGDV